MITTDEIREHAQRVAAERGWKLDPDTLESCNTNTPLMLVEHNVESAATRISFHSGLGGVELYLEEEREQDLVSPWTPTLLVSLLSGAVWGPRVNVTVRADVGFSSEIYHVDLTTGKTVLYK